MIAPYVRAVILMLCGAGSLCAQGGLERSHWAIDATRRIAPKGLEHLEEPTHFFLDLPGDGTFRATEASSGETFSGTVAQRRKSLGLVLARESLDRWARRLEASLSLQTNGAEVEVTIVDYEMEARVLGSRRGAQKIRWKEKLDFRYSIRGERARPGKSSAKGAGAIGAPPPPPAPSGLEAHALSPHSMRITWSLPAERIDSLRLERAIDEGPAGTRSPSGHVFECIAELASTATTFDDTNLMHATTHVYRIQARGAGGLSDYSNVDVESTPSCPTPPTAVPLNLLLVPIEPTVVRVSWTNPAVSVLSTEILLASYVPDPWAPPGTRPPGFGQLQTRGTARSGASSLDISSLVPGGRYDVAVRTLTLCGNGPIVLATITMPQSGVQPPPPPTGLQATAESETSVRISWTASNSNATEIHIHRALAPTPGQPAVYSTAARVPANATTYTDRALEPGSSYTYRLVALNTGGTSLPSTAVVVTTQSSRWETRIAASLPPTASTGSYILTWTVAGLTTTSFVVQESLDVGFTAPQSYPISNAAAPYSRAFSGKPPGSYHYRVGFTGSGPMSAPVSIVVLGSGSTGGQPGPAEVAVFAAADNMLIASSFGDHRNRVFPTSELAVGLDYLDGGSEFRSDFVLHSSALWFDVGSLLNGRTIAAATLRMNALAIAPDRIRHYRVAAIAAPWYPSTITYDNQPDVNLSAVADAPPPITSAIPTEWDVTTIVRQWASGSWQNYGLLLFDDVPSLPLVTTFSATAFQSREVFYTAPERPRLYIRFSN